MCMRNDRATVARHRTAISRTELSRPIRLAMESDLLGRGTSVLDYGCGLGDDVHLLSKVGVKCTGWDPAHRPSGRRKSSDVVNLGYVINVIEDAVERADALTKAWGYCQRLLIVSARHTSEARRARGDEHEDGVITSRQTFQKFYSQDELRSWIVSVLGESPIAVAPGVFFVFRDSELMQSLSPRKTPSSLCHNDLRRVPP